MVGRSRSVIRAMIPGTTLGGTCLVDLRSPQAVKRGCGMLWVRSLSAGIGGQEARAQDPGGQPSLDGGPTKPTHAAPRAPGRLRPGPVADHRNGGRDLPGTRPPGSDGERRPERIHAPVRPPHVRRAPQAIPRSRCDRGAGGRWRSPGVAGRRRVRGGRRQLDRTPARIRGAHGHPSTDPQEPGHHGAARARRPGDLSPAGPRLRLPVSAGGLRDGRPRSSCRRPRRRTSTSSTSAT